MIPPELSDRNRLAYRAARSSSGASRPRSIDGCCPTSTEPLAARCSGQRRRRDGHIGRAGGVLRPRRRRSRRGGSAGIRVNTVNPDAVLSGSRIWGPDSTWRRERAEAYGIAPDDLEEQYRQRNTLKVNVLPEDIAEAVLHFASPARSGKSTGNVLNVDVGGAAAYSR
jgi:hypothetical protein